MHPRMNQAMPGDRRGARVQLCAQKGPMELGRQEDLSSILRTPVTKKKKKNRGRVVRTKNPSAGEVETEDSVASQPRLLGKFQAREKSHIQTTTTKSGRSLKKGI